MSKNKYTVIVHAIIAMGEWKYVQRHLFLQERQRNVTLRRAPTTKAAVEKQYVLHILSVFVALRMQHAMRMRHIVICGL